MNNLFYKITYLSKYNRDFDYVVHIFIKKLIRMIPEKWRESVFGWVNGKMSDNILKNDDSY